VTISVHCYFPKTWWRVFDIGCDSNLISLSHASIFLDVAIAPPLGRIHAANVIHKDIESWQHCSNLNTGVIKLILALPLASIAPNFTFKSLHLLKELLPHSSPEQPGG